MFKWKVSTLGSSGKRSKSSTNQKLNNATEEDRKHFGEEEQFVTQETAGFDVMTQQSTANLVSTGYYPPMNESHNPQYQLLPHRQFQSIQDFGQQNAYGTRQNGSVYHTISMRQFSQQRQALPDLAQEGLYPPMPDSVYRVSPSQDAAVRHYDMGQPSVIENRNHSLAACESKQIAERGVSPSDNTQAQAYLAWVNWQLQKRPGTAAIQDLSELRDDKLLATLVQIVSSKPLIGLDSRPPTQAVCLINMERILAHLAKQRVKVATITPHDLAGGNVKAIMKLIQSLAAFYKPHSVGSGRGRTSAHATPDLSQPSNRKMSEVSTAGANGQPSMGLTVRAVATLRRPPKTQAHENRNIDGTNSDFLQQKKLNLSTESIDRNMVNAQIQASLRKAESSSQTILTGSRQSPAGKNPVPVASVTATPMVTRSSRVDRKPSSVEKTRSGSMPPMKNLPITALPPQEKQLEQKATVNLAVKRSESRTGDSAKKLQLNRSNSAAVPKITKMDGKSKSESLIRKNDEKKETSFKFWESLKDKGRRKLPESPKAEIQIDEKPLDLSAEDSPVESCKGTLKSGSRGNFTPLEIRGEVEGSSNNSSPVTSDHEEAQMRHTSLGIMMRQDFVGQKADVYDRMEKKLHEVQKWLYQTVMVDSVGKLEPERNREEVAPNVPYDVVLRDLHTARNQLMELQSLLLSASSDVGQQEQQTVVTDSRGTSTAFVEEMDAYGVLKPVAIENLKLADVLPEDASPEKLRQALMKSALRQHRLSSEKAELQKKLEEKEWQLDELRKNMSSPRLLDTSGNSSSLAPTTPQMHRRSKGREELQIARDALTSLRSNFRNEDPNQHTIDTLEQCISMLLERLTASEQSSHSPFGKGSEGSGATRRPISSHHGSQETTKALYFTERSLTPFLIVLQGRLGEVTLRDFKMALDRSTRYRFMFKTPDPDYGFVKQELSDDDSVLPGFDGKIVAWLEEDC